MSWGVARRAEEAERERRADEGAHPLMRSGSGSSARSDVRALRDLDASWIFSGYRDERRTPYISMRMSETWEKNSDPNYHVLAWMAAKGPPEPESYLDRVRAEKRSEEPAEIIAHYAHDVRKSILMKNPYLRMSYRAPDDPVVKKPMPDVFLGKIKSDVTQGFEIGYARSYS